MSRIERIQTTHVSSLPRSAMVSDVVGAADQGTAVSDELFDAVLSEAIDVEVERQKLLGVDIVSDGEFSKMTYASDIQHRLTGFSGDSALFTPADLDEYPGAAEHTRRRRASLPVLTQGSQPPTPKCLTRSYLPQCFQRWRQNQLKTKFLTGPLARDWSVELPSNRRRSTFSGYRPGTARRTPTIFRRQNAVNLGNSM